MSKYARRTEKKYILAEEAAFEQVMELLEYYDIDVEKMPEEGEGISPKAAFERALDQLTEYFRTGQVELNRDKDGKLEVVHHLAGSETVTFREVNAKAKLAMDRVKGTGYSRIYAFMGSLCGLGSAAIEKMPPRDLAVVEVLGTVFSNA